MWISADKRCLHFSNSHDFELNFGITPNHEGPCALPILSTPFHFIATYFLLWSTKLLCATHICYEEYVFTLESQASLKSQYKITTTLSSAVHFNPVHQVLIYLHSHAMLHSYTISWTLVRCLSSTRQCKSSNCLQLRALIFEVFPPCFYEGKSENKVPYFIVTTPHSETPLYWLKVQTLVARRKHFRRSSSAIFVEDAVLQWVLYCVCRHKKGFNQGQLQLKFIVKFRQFMALMWWPCSMCENGVGNLVAVTWVWQMNKGAGVLPHQQILSLQLRRLCMLIAECCLNSWKNSLIFHMAQSETLFTNVQGIEKCAAGGSLDNWHRTTRKNRMGASPTLMIMVRISWSKSLPGMKLGTFISSPTRKNIFVPSDSNHMMTSSMRCKHGCMVRIPPSIDRVLRNGFPA